MKNIDISHRIELFSVYLACLSLVGAFVYRLFDLNAFSVALIVILSLASYFTIVKITEKVNPKETENHKQTEAELGNNCNKKAILFLRFSYPIIILASFCILFHSRTGESIISPWEKTPKMFFLFFFLAVAILNALIAFNRKISVFHFIALNLLFNSVSLLIYKYGFGFDFFIHGATMDLIDKIGSVEPKPFYYLGQYVPIIIIHKIIRIPIFYIHLLFVPLLSAILIPLSLNKLLTRKNTPYRLANFLMLIFAIIPFGIFYNTTPQNLAYLFLFLVALRGLYLEGKYDFAYIYLFSLAAVFIQPIAGIPALLLSISLTANKLRPSSLKRIIYPAIYFVTAIILPSLFFILNSLNKIEANKSTGYFPFLKNTLIKFIPQFPNSENIFLNTIYFFDFNAFIFIFLLISAGIIIKIKYSESLVYRNYLFMAISLAVSYFLMQKISFGYLINYEQSDYSERILLLIIIFSLPFIIDVLVLFISEILRKEKAFQAIYFLSLPAFAVIAIYLNYPRIDNYYNSHGYSMGIDDIMAVRKIQEETQGKYIVLANQQTSVAALKEFGFDKYYEAADGQKIFYYPIPTGGRLYAYYLDMVNNKPSRSTVLEAMDYAKVDTAFFAVSKYWWASSKIIDEAKLAADSWQEVNHGNIYIFKFHR